MPKSQPKEMLEFIYANLPGSSGETWNDPISTNGGEFLNDGYYRKFDQQEFIEQAAADYKAIPGNENQTIDF